MDLNDPRRRLQVLNSNSPSIRLSVQPQQPLKVASPAPTRQITSVGNANNTQFTRVSPSAASYIPPVPQNDAPKQGWFGKAVSSVINPFAKFGNELGAAYQLIQPTRAGVDERYANAQHILNGDGGLLHQGGVLGGKELNSNDSIFIGDGAVKNIEKTVGTGANIGTFFAGGGEGNILKGILAGTIAGGIGSSANQLADKGHISLPELGIEAGLGGAAGGAGEFLGNIFSRAVQPITDRFGDIAKKIAKEKSAKAITRRFGVPEDTAKLLSDVKDPNIVRAVLDQTQANGVPIKNWTVGTPGPEVSPDAQLSEGIFNPNNPPQSALPVGTHAPGSPDPVKVLSENVKKYKNAEEFQKYYDNLTGEDKAVADSALNGKTPEEFYNEVKGTQRKTSGDLNKIVVPEGQISEVQARTALRKAGYIPDEINSIIDGAKYTNKLGDESISSTSLFDSAGKADIPSEGNRFAYSSQKTFATVTDETNSLMNDLRLRAESTPVANGMKRVYQVSEDGTIGDWVFTDPSSLENFINGRESSNMKVDFYDVPEGSLKPTENGADVFRINPDELKKSQSGTSEAAPTGDLQASQGDLHPDNHPTDITPEDAKAIEAAGGNVQAAKEQIAQAAIDAQKAYDEALAVRPKEKAERAAKAEEAYWAAGGGEEGMKAKLSALRGSYTGSGFNPITVDEATQRAILDDIANSGLSGFGKTNTQNAMRKLWGTMDGKPAAHEIKYINMYLGKDVGDAIKEAIASEPKTWREKAAQLVGEIVGLPKSIMASWDLSATLRQGGVLASRFPKEFADAFQYQLKAFGSEEGFQKGAQEILGSKYYESAVAHKLANDAAEGITGTEEQFVSNLAERMHLPGIKRSDRAYSMMLSKFRQNVYDKIVGSYESRGIALGDKELDDLAKFINTATGRGDLGKYLEQHSQTLSTALFSPRLWKSRLDMLNPVYYAKLSGPARKYALQSAGTFAAEASAILGLATLAGAKVETDLRSSDFGKIKVGNTRYDILGGMQQNLVFAWRELTGEKKNSETGDVTKFAHGITDLINPKTVDTGSMVPNRLGVFGDMLENKSNPTLAAALRIGRGKDRGGNPVNVFSELAKLVTPLPVSGIAEATNDIGSIKNPVDLLKGTAINLPDVFGVSTQTYGTTKTKDKGAPDATGVPTFKGKVTPNMVTDSQGNILTDDKGKPVTVKIPNGATDLEIKALKDQKRSSALRDRYVRTLSDEDQALIKLSDKELKNYVKDGTISQGTYDHVKNIQKTAESQSKDNNYDVPDGVTSPLAVATYQKFNSMDEKDQKYWLSDKNPPDESSKQITNLLNKSRPKGLSAFKPSNAIAKLYADYEKDIQSHPEYTNIDKEKKAKAFNKEAYQLNYGDQVKDVYTASAANLRSMIAGKEISKADLDKAIKMDNELYTAGLISKPKFSKKFRGEYGYDYPASASGGSGGSSGSKNAYLSSFLVSGNAGQSKGNEPQFSARSRSVPSFKNIRLPKGSSSPKVTIKL